jgi:hypothetical protein
VSINFESQKGNKTIILLPNLRITIYVSKMFWFVRASPAEPLLNPSSYFWGSEIKKLTPAGSLLKPSNSRGLSNHPLALSLGGTRQGPQITVGAGSDIQVNYFIWLYVDDYVI